MRPWPVECSGMSRLLGGGAKDAVGSGRCKADEVGVISNPTEAHAIDHWGVSGSLSRLQKQVQKES